MLCLPGQRQRSKLISMDHKLYEIQRTRTVATIIAKCRVGFETGGVGRL